MRAKPVRERILVEFAAATLVAFAVTWTAFSPGLRARFVSDDVNAIVDNEWVTGPLDPVGIFRNFSWWGQSRSDAAGYRPVATLSFALNHRLSGADPAGFRVVNFVLHALCAGALFAFSRLLGLGREAAAVAAAIFTLLPVHSESVVWIVGRAELGAAAGFLAAAIACLHHRRCGSRAALVAAALAVATGMAFKENAVTVLAMPAVFFLVLERGETSRRRDLASFAALAAGAITCALLRASAHGPAFAAANPDLLDNPLSVVGTATRLLGAVAVLGRYVALTLWPASLSVDYSFDALGIGPGFVANADTGVALLFVAAAAWAFRSAPGRRDVVRVGLLAAAASYSIVSNTVFVLGTILGERLFYLPTAGLCLALGATAESVFASAKPLDAGSARKKRDPHPRYGRTAIALAAMLAMVCVAAIVVDRRRAAEWQTPVSIFEAAVATVPRSARAQMEYASALGNAGRVDEAVAHFGTALAIKPDYAAAAYNLGNTLARATRYEEAAGAYRRAVASDPRLVRAWHNLALTERIRGRPDAWLEAIRAAVALSPSSPVLENELAEALLAAGRYDEAVAAYDRLEEGGAGTAATWYNRAVARHHLGGCGAAVDDYRRAAEAPGAPREAFTAAASCLRELGRNEDAEAIEEAAKVANRGTRR